MLSGRHLVLGGTAKAILQLKCSEIALTFSSTGTGGALFSAWSRFYSAASLMNVTCHLFDRNAAVSGMQSFYFTIRAPRAPSAHGLFSPHCLDVPSLFQPGSTAEERKMMDGRNKASESL